MLSVVHLGVQACRGHFPNRIVGFGTMAIETATGIASVIAIGIILGLTLSGTVHFSVLYAVIPGVVLLHSILDNVVTLASLCRGKKQVLAQIANGN